METELSQKRLKPLIRFKGFTDVWEQRKFSNYSTSSASYRTNGAWTNLKKNNKEGEKIPLLQSFGNLALQAGWLAKATDLSSRPQVIRFKG
jgi:hypothetical protein